MEINQTVYKFIHKPLSETVHSHKAINQLFEIQSVPLDPPIKHNLR